MKRVLRIVGLLLALPVALILGGALWFLVTAFANKTGDDAAHVASKTRYLQRLETLAATQRDRKRPNVLIVYYDDLGYGDFGFTGSKAIHTPNIDALAKEGVILSNYHSPSPVCSPSRAGLLTGRLPPRAGVPSVLRPGDDPLRLANYAAGSSNRLPPEEITLANALKADGYRTALVGKWHLGDEAPSLPNDMGFESFFGSLYSVDMKAFAIWRDGKVAIPAPADKTKIDALYTNEVVRLIQQRQTSAEPFFIYFAHNYPHIPFDVASENRGRSAGGLYGDVVEALDDGIGKIVAALKAAGQYDDTILIVTSDNGPWFEGSPGHYRGRKGQTFEGGQHVPFLIHWPDRLKGGRSLDTMAMGTDILPTLFDWIGIPLPVDRRIDGTSLAGVLEGKAAAPHRYTYFYSSNQLMAVSDGRFKYHPRQPYTYLMSGNPLGGIPMRQGPWLFDLQVDQDESYNISMKYPDIVKKLKAALEARQREDARNLRGWIGPENEPSAKHLS